MPLGTRHESNQRILFVASVQIELKLYHSKGQRKIRISLNVFASI